MTNADKTHISPRRRHWMILVLLTAGVLGSLVAVPKVLGAVQEPVNLGSATGSAVVAGKAVAGTDAVTITGDLDLSPGTTLTGFPPGEVRTGSVYLDDDHAKQAAAAAAAAYPAAAGRPPTATGAAELGGTTLTDGVYRSAGDAFRLTGTLTLDAEGDPSAVFIFQADSLNVARVGHVSLMNGARADNVVWQVGDSALLGTYATFRGNVLARNSITLARGAVLYGRAMALNDSVTLNGTNGVPATRITLPIVHYPRTTTTLTSSPNPSTVGQAVTFTATVRSVRSDLPSPTGRVIFRDGSAIIGTALTDVTGVAVFTTPRLAAGTHQITAVYISRGTAFYEAWIHFAPSRSAALSQVVNAAGM